VIATSVRPALAISLACLLPLGCSNATTDDDVTGDGPAAATNDDVTGDGPAETAPDEGEEGVSAETGHAENIATLIRLLPPDTRGVLAVDVGRLLSGESSADFTTLLNGEGADPALNGLLEGLGALAGSVDVPRVMTSALLAQTTDAADGLFLLARLQGETIDEVVVGPAPTPDGTYGPKSRALYLDASGNHLSLLPGGVLVVGTTSAVELVVDAADGVTPVDASAIVPFLDALAPESELSFVYGLPALFDDDVTPDRSLRGAAVMSGSLDVAEGAIGGEVAFHTSNASEFVEAYNALNRPSTQGDDPLEQPLILADPVAEGLGQVVLTIPPSPLESSFDEVVASRNIFKKLFVGMEALDYAEGVAERSEPAWLDFVVRSEADIDTPPSPGSVYIRWEFRDEAAIEAFEQNELPAGFRLAPTRFLESDDSEGEYFLALNLYNAGGGSIVSGARAEWDVFVHPPDGADPNAGERPRFMVVGALAEDVSADAGNLLTPAEPLSHALVDDLVVSSVRRFEGDRAVPVFESTFPVPDPDVNEVARFTREMAIGNDYIYWEHGVSDRVLYNATTFNHDAYLVDTARMTFTDDSPWAQYLKPAVKDAVYYVNTLEYVASPMANLDSDFLDITPEWLAELVGFTTNGHQEGLMRKAVEQLFRGEADALVGLRVANETPSTYYHFEITDPDGLSAALDLPPGHSLAPIRLFEGGDEGHYLTLSIYEVEDSVEGTRAEWSVYTDDGDGRPNLLVIDLMTADVGFDPVSIINLPSDVRHDVADGVVSTHLASVSIDFEASFETAGATEEELSMDWIEAGDIVCSSNGICDKFYYDAETLDVPVQRPTGITVNEFSTPWNAYVSATPSIVFYRDNAQEYVVKRWHNLKVFVDELPFSGLENRTHELVGSGTLVGRQSDVADSVYAYTGDVVVDGNQLRFSIDQQVDNALGVGHIFTTGSFDLATGTGTQTVVDCQGSALLCSDIENGSSAFYTAQDLDASDPDAITWQVSVDLDLGGSFGTADSSSTFVASRVD
jgi:hypothetical protein